MKLCINHCAVETEDLRKACRSGTYRPGAAGRRPSASRTWILVLALLFLALQGYGQVIRGATEIKVDQGLRFGGQVFDLPSHGGSAPFEAGKDSGNADLILKTTRCPLCIGCCCLWELGSSRPFHLSKVAYGATDFSTVLNLSDSTRFEPVDSTREGSRTFLPHTRKVAVDGSFLVFRNSRSQYILARITAITHFIPDYANPTRQCTDGLKLDWMIQGNGQPYFPAATSLSGAGRKAGSGWPETGLFLRRFLIDGRRIPCAPPGNPAAEPGRN